MEKKLVVQFGENKIVAEINDGNVPEIPPELCIYICDKNGMITQDICLVRPHYEYNHEKNETETDNDYVDCIVWGEAGSEDYTDKHVITVCDWSEEE